MTYEEFEVTGGIDNNFGGGPNMLVIHQQNFYKAAEPKVYIFLKKNIQCEIIMYYADITLPV